MLAGISWVWWAIGTFGVAGVVAMAILAPAALLIAWDFVLSILKWMIGTRIGCAILAFIIAFLIADIHRSRLDEANWQKQIADFKAAEVARDAGIDKEIGRRVQVWIDAEPKIEQQEDTQAQETKDAIKKPDTPTIVNVCRVGADAGRLRTLAGITRSGHHRQVLKAAWKSVTSGHRGTK